MIRLRRGLDVPISGAPSSVESLLVRSTYLDFLDFEYFRASVLVAEGELVQKGQALVASRQHESLLITSPVSGTIKAINRAQKRRLMSIEIESPASSLDDSAIRFSTFSEKELETLSREKAEAFLLKTGLMAGITARPFGSMPEPQKIPQAIFVNAMDTNPLALNMSEVLQGREDDLKLGLMLLSRLTDGLVYYCTDTKLQVSDLPKGIHHERFYGSHPSGLSGTHIHFLHPIQDPKKDYLWSLNVQEVLAMGKTLKEGELDSERMIAVGGPVLSKPAMVKTTLGASLVELFLGRCDESKVAKFCKRPNGMSKPCCSQVRLIAGSLLHGRAFSKGSEGLGFKHYHATAIDNTEKRPFMGWLSLGVSRFSFLPIYLSKFFKPKAFSFDTRQNGAVRSLVHMSHHQRVLGLGLEIAPILRALASSDDDLALKQGAIELLEEDLALCSFVDHSKNDFGYMLREFLNRVHAEYCESH